MSRSSHASLLMFVLLTIGYGVVHGVVAFWGITCLQVFFPTPQLHESIRITQEGEPLIEVWGGERTKSGYRHLDGTIQQDFIKRSFQAPLYLPKLTEPAEAISWNGRIAGFFDYQTPGTCWYLIAPPNRLLTAYFVGYDPKSRRIEGYIGLNGFSSEMPTIDESFPIHSSYESSFAHVMTAAVQNSAGIEQFNEPDAEWTTEWIQTAGGLPDHVWILSKGTVYEIRLRERAVHKLVENRPDLHSLTSFSIDREGKTLKRLALNGESELLIVEPQSGQSESVKLDPTSANSNLFFYQLKNGQRLLSDDEGRGAGNRSWTGRVKWLDAEGHVEREAETKLNYKPPSPPLDIGLAAYLGFPSPLVALGSWLATPFLPDYSMVANSPLRRLSEFFQNMKLWLGLSLLTGIATGWASRRRERDIFGSSSWFWPILVGAIGWFGWMGYICLRPLPARLPHGQWLPAQPEPAQPLGTEIFA